MSVYPSDTTFRSRTDGRSVAELDFVSVSRSMAEPTS